MLKGILNHHGLTEIVDEEEVVEEEKTQEELNRIKEYEKFIDSCYEEFNHNIATQVCNASDIDDNTFEKLKRQYDLTEEERRQVQKHIFQSTFNYPVLNPELFLELNDRRKQFKNAQELYQNKDNVDNYIKVCIETYATAKPNMETVDRITSNSVVSRYCKLFHILKIYQAYGFDGPFDTKTINEIPYETLKQFVVNNFKKIEASFGQPINKKKLKDFQELKTDDPKGRKKISTYLNDKLNSMLGSCGKVSRKNKKKGSESYGINGVEQYYKDLGVRFYEPRKRMIEITQE
jgi:hypothetical protein